MKKILDYDDESVCDYSDFLNSYVFTDCYVSNRIIEIIKDIIPDNELYVKRIIKEQAKKKYDINL